MIKRWLTPGIGVKRWLVLLIAGMFGLTLSTVFALWGVFERATPNVSGWGVLAFAVYSLVCVVYALYRFINVLIAPYKTNNPTSISDAVYSHMRRRRGVKFVAIGGGTGLPSVLRAMKSFTGNLTAIVTVADDGGSSGRLRREMGVLPPGDLRNNIVALADDESLMARLFQYRFSEGDMSGHAFGNLFIAALSGVAGSLELALIETGRVLNIQGRVLPSTLSNVSLVADVRPPGKTRTLHVQGESKIAELGGQIEQLSIEPQDALALQESVQAILDADLIVIGPGSLYTSILPNLLVQGIADALRASRAYKVYVCNVATQPGETEGFNVADHVLVLEQYIGRGVFQAVLANNAQPVENAGENTRYVAMVSPHHEIAQRYEVRYCDLTDAQRPWRHDPLKLAQALLEMRGEESTNSRQPDRALL